MIWGYLAVGAALIAIALSILDQWNINRKKKDPQKYNGPWLCEMCYPDHTEIGNIAPSVTVVVDQYGMYSICYGSQGHKDSLYQMQTKPFPDPWEDLTDEEIEASGDEGYEGFNFWYDKAQIDKKTFFYWLGTIEACNYLVEELGAGGYKQKEDGNVWMYMFHRAGVIIADYEAAQAAEG